MTNAELRAALMANEHQHALEGVGKVRFLMLEGQLARAVEARKQAERTLREYVCSEQEELNRVRAENRRLRRTLEVLGQALSSAAPRTVQPAQAVEPNPPRPYQRPGSKRLPMKNNSAIRASPLFQRMLWNEPLPGPPEPGTFDPTIDEET